MEHIELSITQNDEFCEVKEEFIEYYNSGMPVSDITKTILDEYRKEFDETDGVFHNVYFAIAYCEWLCCEQSDTIMKAVSEIIENNTDILYIKELGASESDVKYRRKQLDSFLAKIKTPKEKPQKRCPPPKDKTLPPLKAGDLFSYKCSEKYRVAVVLDKYKRDGFKEQLLICILKKEYSDLTAEFLNEDIGFLGGFCADTMLAKSIITVKKHLDLPEGIADRLLGKNRLLFNSKKDFYRDYSDSPSLTLADLLRKVH